jgi:hypothetical protein
MHPTRLSSAGSLAVMTAVLLLAGCSGPGASQPDPAQVLKAAGQAMSTIKSVKADTTFGPGVTLQGLSLTTATSTIQLPDQSDTTFKVKQGDFLVDVRVVTAGGHVYLRLPFSRFSELSESQAAEIPNLSRLFDPQAGLPSLLPAGRSPSYQGTEKAGDAQSDRVATSYGAAEVGRLLGVTPAGPVNATIWAGQSDHLVRRVVLSGPLLEAGKNVRVQVDLHDFNQPVTITAPSVSPAASPAVSPAAAAPSASPSRSP